MIRQCSGRLLKQHHLLRPLFSPLSTIPPHTDQAPWFKHVGESALLLRFGHTINQEVNDRVLSCMEELDKSTFPSGVTEILPAYASLLVHFDPLDISSHDVESWCRRVVEESTTNVNLDADNAADNAAANAATTTLTSTTPKQRRVVTIPVDYGSMHGPDMDEVMRLTGLSTEEEVTRAHSEGDYRVFFLGKEFIPDSSRYIVTFETFDRYTLFFHIV